MTENETIREMTFEEEYEILQKEKEELFAMEICDYEPPFANCVVRRALRCIKKLLEEIQQYRAIGTVEQLEWCKDASHWKELFKEKLEKYEAIGTVEDIQEVMALCKSLQETVCRYMNIGTIEEFKALKEKNTKKEI